MLYFKSLVIGLLPVLHALLPSAVVQAAPGKACTPRHVKRFQFELTWEKRAPDGFEREMILVNKQFPGPALKLIQGDNVEIVVTNKLPFDTTVHFHGIEHIGTPWSDGVPGISQRPIQPGHSFTYKWKATQHGSYWYHAHSKDQIEDGLYGAISIAPKAGTSNPFAAISSDPAQLRQMERAEKNARPLILSDWRHITSQTNMELAEKVGIEMLCYDAILINGKGSVGCWDRADIQAMTPPPFLGLLAGLNLTDKGCLPPKVIASAFPDSPANLAALPPSVFETCTSSTAPHEVIEVTTTDEQQWVALDLISATGVLPLVASIDEHAMWVYAVDGSYIKPSKVDAVPLLNGDRFSVLVQLKTGSQIKDYTIRVTTPGSPQLMETTATLSYTTANPSSKTSTPFITRVGTNTTADTIFFVPSTASVPYAAPPVSQHADTTHILNLAPVNSSIKWSMNGTALYNNALIDTSSPSHIPVLFQPLSTALASSLTSSISLTTQNNTWVDLIFTSTSPGSPSHQIHKHSNKAYILGSGVGKWKWNTVQDAVAELPPNTLNLVNPPYRDGFETLPVGVDPATGTVMETWLVVRYHVVNPGPYVLHCHVQSHMSGGMGFVIFDGVDAWPALGDMPAEYRDY